MKRYYIVEEFYLKQKQRVDIIYYAK